MTPAEVQTAIITLSVLQAITVVTCVLLVLRVRDATLSEWDVASPGLPAIGSVAPEHVISSRNAGDVKIGGTDGSAALLVFLSVGCGICHMRADQVRSAMRRYRRRLTVQVLLVLRGSDSDAMAFIDRHRLHAIPWCMESDLPFPYGFDLVPVALILRQDGSVHTSRQVGTAQSISQLFRRVARDFSTSTKALEVVPDSPLAHPAQGAQTEHQLSTVEYPLS